MQHSITNITGRFLRSARTSDKLVSSKSKAFSAYPPNDMQVEHNISKQEFFICMGEDCAVIQYKKKNNTLDLYHTEVPTIFRGQGVAARLAKGAFEYISQNNMKMKLSCEYLQKYYNENETPELKKLLA